MYLTVELVACPRCGSTYKHPFRADLYRCDDCGLHYHLDWVGPYVQVRQPTAALRSPTSYLDWLPLKVLLLVIVAISLLAGLSFWVGARLRAPRAGSALPAQPRSALTP
jgi:hypothetical protein